MPAVVSSNNIPDAAKEPPQDPPEDPDQWCTIKVMVRKEDAVKKQEELLRIQGVKKPWASLKAFSSKKNLAQFKKK